MSKKSAIVTGAGSGVGRAVALQLVKEGWTVGLIGRRAAALEETRALGETNRDGMIVARCDVGDPAAVERTISDLIDKLGGVQALVNAAGTNAPRRGWDVLSIEDYRDMIDANLNGVFYCCRAVLPAMRQQRSGTIVNIVSDAGLAASPKAGPAYVASKFGVTGLTQSLNAEERPNGIRCCGIFPGDIDTPILSKRPTPPTPEARAKMMRPEDVAECVMLAINLPERAVVEMLVVRPR